MDDFLSPVLYEDSFQIKQKDLSQLEDNLKALLKAHLRDAVEIEEKVLILKLTHQYKKDIVSLVRKLIETFTQRFPGHELLAQYAEQVSRYDALVEALVIASTSVVSQGGAGKDEGGDLEKQLLRTFKRCVNNELMRAHFIWHPQYFEHYYLLKLFFQLLACHDLLGACGLSHFTSQLIIDLQMDQKNSVILEHEESKKKLHAHASEYSAVMLKRRIEYIDFEKENKISDIMQTDQTLKVLIEKVYSISFNMSHTMRSQYIAQAVRAMVSASSFNEISVFSLKKLNLQKDFFYIMHMLSESDSEVEMKKNIDFFCAQQKKHDVTC
jgi:hypothetical protein